MRKFHTYTDEQINYIRHVCKGRSRLEIMDMFNQKFNASVTPGSIRSVMSRHKIKNNMQGYTSRLEKGHTPWNKGMKGLQLSGEEGRFKVGDTHHGMLPIGTESIKEDCVWIKTDNPNKWERKHLYIWRQEHGDIPEGCVIRFKDDDKMNVTLDNLFMVEHRVMTSVVMRNLDYSNPALKVAIHNVAELELATKDKEDY